MEYKNEKLSARFVVPDNITVRQQLAYYSEVTASNSSTHIEKLWTGARALIIEWECLEFPDRDTDLNSVDNPHITDVIMWASLEVKRHINALEYVPKNS